MDSKEYIIRQAIISDMDDLYDICIRTGNYGEDARDLYNNHTTLGIYYVGPYIVFELDLAFVLEDKQSHLAAILDRNIKHSSSILEVGCGTGQLSLFLKRYNRIIFGIDLSIPSLKLAENFRLRNDISNVFFSKMNIFNLQFKDEVFDYVISNGVLHHTNKIEFVSLT